MTMSGVKELTRVLFHFNVHDDRPNCDEERSDMGKCIKRDTTRRLAGREIYLRAARHGSLVPLSLLRKCRKNVKGGNFEEEVENKMSCENGKMVVVRAVAQEKS